MVDRLNETLNKMPKYNDNLQRSVYFKFEKVVEKYVKRFLSTTKGQVYNEDGQVQIYIQNAHNGIDISSVNAHKLGYTLGNPCYILLLRHTQMCFVFTFLAYLTEKCAPSILTMRFFFCPHGVIRELCMIFVMLTGCEAGWRFSC